MLAEQVLRRLTPLILGIIVIFGTIIAGNAQENKQTQKIEFFPATGAYLTDIVDIDAEYGKEHNIPILTPFRIQVPRQDGVKRFVEFGTKPNSTIIKINFATGGEDTPMEERELIENLQFIPLNIEMTDHEDRIKALTNLMAVVAFNNATEAYEQKEFIGARRTKIGDIDVIDAVGSYIEPNLGLIYVRMTGYLNPNSEDGIFALANIIASKYEITNLEQLFLTGSGKTIESFEYISE